MFDKNNFEYVNGKRLDDNGNVISDDNSSYSLTLISVKPNTTYTIQGTQSEATKTTRIYYYNNQKQFISRTRPFDKDSYSFTTLENCNYIGLQLRNSEYINVNIIQLEEGTTATPYVPHQEQNLPFTLEEGQFLADEESLEDNGINKNEIQVILNGSENWGNWSRPQNYGYLLTGFTDRIQGATQYCTHLIQDYGKAYDGEAGYFGITADGLLNVCVDEFDTLAKWKQFLAEQYANGTPVKIVYKTATEQIVPYNSTQQEQYNAIKKATSYAEKTYIQSSSDELNPNLDVIAYKEVPKMMKFI